MKKRKESLEFFMSSKNECTGKNGCEGTPLEYLTAGKKERRERSITERGERSPMKGAQTY